MHRDRQVKRLSETGDALDLSDSTAGDVGLRYIERTPLEPA
jgi:hypothetical protein